jgi:hypothetical protein
MMRVVAAGARLADCGRYRGLPARVFHHAAQSCASAGTIALTVLAGPLNYGGVNPKVMHCNAPQPQLITPTAQFQPM